jgi:hypothetical protein
MTSKIRLTAVAVGVALVLGFVYYVFTAPYTRFRGVRIGGQLTPAPSDWGTVNGEKVALLKLAGFPPFVIHVWYVAEGNGIITATRPDGGYWARRVRSNPDGWMRIGDRTYVRQGSRGRGAAPVSGKVRRQEQHAHALRLQG